MEIVVKDIGTGELVTFNSVNEILEEINRDRSDEWVDYDETDWKEGLEEFTEYSLVEIIN